MNLELRVALIVKFAVLFLFFLSFSFPKTHAQKVTLIQEQQMYFHVHDIAYTPDNEYYFTVGGTYFRQQNFVKQWNPDFSLYSFYEGGVYPFYKIEFFPNNTFVTLGGKDKNSLREFILWSDSLDTPIRRLKYNAPEVSDFICLDTTILIATQNKIREINPFSDVEYKNFYVGNSYILQLEKSQNYIYASCADSLLTRWNTEKQRDSIRFDDIIRQFTMINDSCICILRNGKVIKSDFSDYRKELFQIELDEKNQVEISSSGNFIAKYENQEIAIYETNTGEIHAKFKTRKKLLTTMSFSADDMYFFYALSDNKMRILKM